MENRGGFRPQTTFAPRMIVSMDPVSVSAAASAIFKLVDWEKVLKGLATDAAGKGAKACWGG